MQRRRGRTDQRDRGGWLREREIYLEERSRRTVRRRIDGGRGEFPEKNKEKGEDMVTGNDEREEEKETARWRDISRLGCVQLVQYVL